MDKTAIRNFAIEARKILMKSAITEAGFYGITKDGCIDPVQKGNDFEVYETVAGTENRIFGDDIKRRANLVTAIKEQGFDQVIEETAYTWFNRIIAIRFMEVNNYLPTRVRVLSSETGSTTPDIVTQSDTVELNLSSEELERIQTAKRENRYDDAFRSLFIKQCNELNAILPGLFEKTDDYMELLLKITYTGDGVIRMLVDSIPEDNFNVETEGQVEIIGWMYQYYNTELKDDTFAKLKKNVKITKERIPAATQIFTPDWIVRYLVENSLGRVWIEHLRAVDPSVDEKAKAEEFGWKYYLSEAEQETDVQAQLVEIRKPYKDLTPQDIACIDPCMGSGHILVYMFDVLMDIYRSEGFSEREAVFDVLEKNIRGLDIDRRAYQLSYFALMMKARGLNRIFFRGHDDLDGNRVLASPRVYAIEESNSIDRNILSYFGSDLDEIHKNNALNQMNALLDFMIDAREYGSILNIDCLDWKLLHAFANSLDENGQLSLQSIVAKQSQKLLIKLVDIGEILSIKYDAIITNPPYMGNNGMNPSLSKYMKTNYPDEKTDLFAAFIYKGITMAKPYGYNAMVTMQSWMFLESFEAMRKSLYSAATIATCLHMGNMVMGIAFGTAATVFRKNNISSYKARYTYVTIADIEENQPKSFPIEENKHGEVSIERFMDVPGVPVAYWLSERMFSLFKGKTIGSYGETKKGVLTGNDNRFVRTWFEVDPNKIGFGINNHEEMVEINKKWIPATGGGSFRKWYGNFEKVINMENDAYEIQNCNENNYRLRDNKYYFRQCISWSEISNRGFSARYIPQGILFGNSGPVCFFNEDIYYYLAVVNSNVGRKMLELLSPTMTFGPEQVKRIPIVKDRVDEVAKIARECVEICQSDWDSYEYSWGYRKHPWMFFIKEKNTSIEACDQDYAAYLENALSVLKEKEETINRLLVDIYKLNGEVETEVRPEDIILRRKNDQYEAESFVSYAVGCILGRFNPFEECVQKDFNNCKFELFDTDNVIPIVDEEYFDDDIVARFIRFVEIVFGKDNLDNNLDYIASHLPSKGKTTKEILRNYFLNDFIKWHISTYSGTTSGKKPIYWMFSSGAKNGFKCLIYMHRYTADTVGIIRSDYLAKTQNMIENALKNAEYAINTSASAVDKAQATKKRDKYLKQLAEIRAYYPALSHIALQRIELDLDDGVKANYAKFQGIEVSVEGEKKQKVDLLVKI